MTPYLRRAGSAACAGSSSRKGLQERLFLVNTATRIEYSPSDVWHNEATLQMREEMVPILVRMGWPLGISARLSRLQQASREMQLQALEGAEMTKAQTFGYIGACARCGNEDVLFVVVGGGQKAKRQCERMHWHWIAEDSDVSRGRVT